MVTECPYCGGEYKRIGQHWAFNDTHRPDFSQRQKEIIEGLLLGDGCITTENGGANSVLIVEMVEEKFIEWLDGQLGIFSRGYTLSKTSSESAESNSDQRFSSDPDAYRDLYRIVSRPHPYLSELEEKYYNERKVYPKDIDMTPIKLKMWYISDGYLDNDRRSGRGDIANITNTVQIHDEGFCDIFNKTGLSPTIVPRSEKIYFITSEIDTFFTYIGGPPPGFEYKWPEKYK